MIGHLAAEHANRTKVCPTELLFKGQHTELRHAGMAMAAHETFSWWEIVEEGKQEKENWRVDREQRDSAGRVQLSPHCQIPGVSQKSKNSKLQFQMATRPPWWGRISGWESACQCKGHEFDTWSRKIPHASEQLSLCPTAPEPTLWRPPSRNYWARALQLLKLVFLEPVLATRDATTMRSPCTAAKSSPCSLQLEKACVQPQRPSTAKINE